MKKKSKLKNKFFPVNIPLITEKNISDVSKSMRSGWVSSEGPNVKIFEEKISKYVGRRYGIAVSSGTAALEIAVKCLNFKPGSEIIIPNFSIISTALAVIKNNHKPILIDADKDNWNMKIDDIEKKISKKTKCIIATHIYGFPLDMEKIIKICKKYKLALIEDAAEMLGHRYKNKFCGSYGDLSIFSFYPNKHITTGEGGMILTDNNKKNIKCKNLRNLSFGIKENRFKHTDIGWNYRLTNLQASLGLSQLKDLKKNIKRKKEIGKLYYENLKNIKGIYIQPPKYKSYENIYWVFGVVLNKKFSRVKILKNLMNKRVQTRPFFYPMHKQPILKKFNYTKQMFPNSNNLSSKGFYLPSGLGLTNKDIIKICKIFINVIKNFR
jgi:perosamine synthetase